MKITETMESTIALEEAVENQPRRIKAQNVIVAGVINGNGRRYPASVLQAAVEQLKNHLHESAGQGRMVQVLGEAEHPSDKGAKRSNLLETVIKWTEVQFDGAAVSLGGNILETSKGKDLLALMQGGVTPGVSLRGYGSTDFVKENGQKVEEVRELTLTGFDLVLEPSFVDAQAVLESKSETMPETGKELEMSEELEKKLQEAETEKVKLLKQLEDAQQAQAKLAERERVDLVAKAIAEATKELPYGEKNGAFVEAVKAANPQDEQAVNSLVEAKRKEWDAIFAEVKLGKMGLNKSQVSGVRPVLEAETGTPEFASGGFLITEAIRKYENRAKRNIDLRAESPAAVFTQKLLERFDALNMRHLLAEQRMLQEAEQTSDLNLPYSVSRAIIAEAFPDLVAANIFDVGVIDSSPTRLYFEATTGESGYTGTVTDEVVTGGAEGTWYDLAYGRVTPDSVTVTSNPAGTTYVEGTDYVIDYAAGRIKFLTPGSIGANDVLVDYSYTAIRKGEMTPIERVKLSLSYMTIEAAADRLADQISREAIVFSQSQLGMDAVAMTMASMMRQIRRKIDQGLLYAAFSAVKAVASNKTADWTIGTTDADYASLVRLMGNASVIVANRFYTPTFYLMSVTNADRVSNWSGFQLDGFPNAMLNAAGFAGMIKGKPIYASTEFPDTLVIAGNRELVAHRVFKPASIYGPYPTYDVSGGTSKLLAADQYYVEEFNVTESPINEKGAFVPVVEAGS